MKQIRSDRKKQFDVMSSSENVNREIEDYLKLKFGDIQVNKQIGEKLWLFVKGESYYYKRFLESDLEKLLN